MYVEGEDASVTESIQLAVLVFFMCVWFPPVIQAGTKVL